MKNKVSWTDQVAGVLLIAALLCVLSVFVRDFFVDQAAYNDQVCRVTNLDHQCHTTWQDIKNALDNVL